MVDKVTVVRYSFAGEKFELLVKPDPALDFKLGRISERVLFHSSMLN